MPSKHTNVGSTSDQRRFPMSVDRRLMVVCETLFWRRNDDQSDQNRRRNDVVWPLNDQKDVATTFLDGHRRL